MKIEVSESTFKKLQELSEPLVDTSDAVIIRLIDHFNKETKPMKCFTETNHNNVTFHDLRGFQKELWEEVISRIPFETFSLTDVYERKKPLVDKRPHVKEIEASIRGTLEKLRDKGYIKFVDNRGRYQKLK